MSWLKRRAEELSKLYCECGLVGGYCKLCDADDTPSAKDLMIQLAREFAERVLGAYDDGCFDRGHNATHADAITEADKDEP